MELTDEQLVSISGGIGHAREVHDQDRDRWGDDDDRRGNRWDDNDRDRGHWVWDRWRQEWVWV